MGAPVIIGMILGALAEQNFRQAMTISQGDMSVFFTHSIAAFLLALAPASSTIMRSWTAREEAA